jgi:hypothetical protein
MCYDQEKFNKLPKKIKEKIKKLEKRIEQRTKGIQLDLTKFLIEKRYNNPKDITKLWGIDLNTAKKYLKEAEKASFDRRAEPDIEKIKIEKNVSWLEAVKLYYEELMRPKCGYGRL